MYTNILALLYPVIKDFPEAPLSVALLAKGLAIEEAELSDCFTHWFKEGLIRKKYATIEVYKLTEKGLLAVRRAYDNQ